MKPGLKFTPCHPTGGRLLVDGFRLCSEADAEVLLCKGLEMWKESMSQISIGEKNLEGSSCLYVTYLGGGNCGQDRIDLIYMTSIP